MVAMCQTDQCCSQDGLAASYPHIVMRASLHHQETKTRTSDDDRVNAYMQAIGFCYTVERLEHRLHPLPDLVR